MVQNSGQDLLVQKSLKKDCTNSKCFVSKIDFLYIWSILLNGAIVYGPEIL